MHVCASRPLPKNTETWCRWKHAPHIQISPPPPPPLSNPNPSHRLVANDAESYRYLVESIRKFPDQEAFAELVREAGLRHVEYENLTGGVVAVHSGFKLR